MTFRFSKPRLATKKNPKRKVAISLSPTNVSVFGDDGNGSNSTLRTPLLTGDAPSIARKYVICKAGSNTRSSLAIVAKKVASEQGRREMISEIKRLCARGLQRQ